MHGIRYVSVSKSSYCFLKREEVISRYIDSSPQQGNLSLYHQESSLLNEPWNQKIKSIFLGYLVFFSTLAYNILKILAVQY
jgi:hypothetical protein